MYFEVRNESSFEKIVIVSLLSQAKIVLDVLINPFPQTTHLQQMTLKTEVQKPEKSPCILLSHYFQELSAAECIKICLHYAHYDFQCDM